MLVKGWVVGQAYVVNPTLFLVGDHTAALFCAQEGIPGSSRNLFIIDGYHVLLALTSQLVKIPLLALHPLL